MGDCACHASDLYLKWDGLDLAFVFLELTPRCNNRCAGCSNVFADQRKATSLSGEEWIRLIEKIKPHIHWLKLTGGEPTLHPEFASIIAFLNDQSIPFRLLTNGRWANPDSTFSLLCASPVLESLLISLHGPDPASHEAFTGVPGSFDEAVQTIKRAAEKGLKVATSTVITRYNWQRIEELAQYACSIGACHAAFNRYIGSPLNDIEATPQQTAEAVQQIESLICQGRPLRFGTPIPHCITSCTTPCLAGKAFVTVDPWGKLRPCNHAPQIIGDLKVQSIEEILTGEPLAQWHDYSPAICKSCGLASTCGNGCRAEALLRAEVLQDHFLITANSATLRK